MSQFDDASTIEMVVGALVLAGSIIVLTRRVNLGLVRRRCTKRFRAAPVRAR